MDVRTIGVVANPRKPLSFDVARSVIEAAHRHGIGVNVIQEIAEELGGSATPIARSDLSCACDLIIACGGDGTILNAARLVSDDPVPILGANAGTLGFLAELAPTDIESGIGEIARGEFSVENRMTLHAGVVETGRTISALNDVLITRSNQSRIISLEVSEGDRWVNTYVADGLIIATPTGSTGYALSAGGPIVEPSVDAFVAAPICPHSLTVRPMIFSGSTAFDVRVTGAPECAIELSGDAQEFCPIESGHTVRIRRGERDAKLLHLASASTYYDILRQKLHWGMDKSIQ